MAAEVIGFSDLFDSAFNLAEELHGMHPHSHIPVKLFTDNESLFEVISKGFRSHEILILAF